MKIPALVTLALVATTGPALGQPQVQPGLREQVITLKTGSGQMEAQMAQMQQQLASMPPEQRKMVQDMMARQGAGMGPQGSTVRVCVTPEQARRAELPQHEGNCRHEALPASGATLRYRFSCTGEHPTSGEGEFTLASPTRYSGRASMLTQVQGKPEKVDMTMTGRWIAADCGAIKPRAAAK